MRRNRRSAFRDAEDLGFSLEKTYFDVPRMRSSTSDDFLTSGIAYAFHPHRDTCIPRDVPDQLVAADLPDRCGKCDGFSSAVLSQAVRNGSAEYNYAEWNRTSRQNAAQFIKQDTRKQPKPEEPMELDPQSG